MPTAERAAKNESLFREVNERIAELQEDFGKAYGRAHFICECSYLECTTRLELRLDEYADVRSVRTHFVVAAGHADEENERVVRRTDRYLVVEKQGLAGALVDDRA